MLFIYFLLLNKSNFVGFSSFSMISTPSFWLTGALACLYFKILGHSRPDHNGIGVIVFWTRSKICDVRLNISLLSVAWPGADWDPNSAREIMNTGSHLYWPTDKLTKMLSNLFSNYTFNIYNGKIQMSILFLFIINF